MQAIILSTETVVIPLLLTVIAGLATCIGSLIFLFIKRFKDTHLVFCLGLSAGAMIYVSFVELLRTAISTNGFITANLIFMAGIIFMMIIDFITPHEYLLEKEGLNPEYKQLYPTGVFIAIGITIHNFPEGMAVFLSGVANLHLGIALAIAIAAHNIPEGIAVSMPIYYSTKSKGKAFLYSFLSGIAEPIGAIIALVFFYNILTESIIGNLYAFVAGIMVFISFDELLPQAFQTDHHHHAIYGLLFGIMVMMFSLAF